MNFKIIILGKFERFAKYILVTHVYNLISSYSAVIISESRTDLQVYIAGYLGSTQNLQTLGKYMFHKTLLTLRGIK